MLIDWFTVLAQIVNFLVLVMLMKRFLYSRVIRAMDEREAAIAGRIAEAGQKILDADRQLCELRALKAEQEQQQDKLLRVAQQEAAEERLRLVAKARESAQRLESKWRDELELERQAVLEDVRLRAAGEILAVVRRALADLACSEVQQSAVRVFLEKLQTLDAAALRELTRSEVRVLTPLELPEEARQRLRELLESRAGGPVALRFDPAPDLAWGIELRGNGRRFSWTSVSYVEALEDNLKEALAR